MGATGGLLESSVVDVVVVVDPHENKRPTVDWSVLPMFIVVFVFFNKRPNITRTVYGGKHRQLKRLADERKLT